MGIRSIVISQMSDERYAYFYFLNNFAIFSEEEMDLFADRRTWIGDVVWPEDVVTELKERNSWNQPINPDRMTRVEITRRKPDIRPVSDENIRSGIGQALERDTFIGRLSNVILFSIDNYGRSIHYADFRAFTGHTVFLFCADGSFINFKGNLNPYNYRDQLLEFMQQNNWNMPLE